MLSNSVARAEDVGMSYGAVGVLGALSAAIPRRHRAVWVGMVDRRRRGRRARRT